MSKTLSRATAFSCCPEARGRKGEKMRNPLPPQEFITLREELKISLGAHRELGPDMDDAIVEAFLERVQRSIDARVDMRLSQLRQSERSRAKGRTGRLALLLVFAIPLSAIAAGTVGINGLILVLAALVFLMWLD